MPESPRSVSVARASGLMIAGLFLSRVLGLLRETITAWRLGGGGDADMYRIAFSVPDLLFFLLAGGALSSAFIPVFTECFHTEREKQAWKLFSVLLTATVLVMAVVVLLMEAFTPGLVHIVGPGLKADQVATTVLLSRIVLPAQIAFLAGGLIFGTFYARHQFLLPALSPNIYNIGIICGALVAAPFLVPKASGLMWGALAGAVVGNLVLPAISFVRGGGKFSPSLELRNPEVVRVLKLMLPVVLGLSLPAVYALVARAMASTAPTGSVAAIENANRLMQAPLGIFGQALGLAVFPSLAAFVARKEIGAFSATLHRSLRTALFLTIPAAMLMAVIPGEIIRAALEYGRFKAANTQYTVMPLMLFAVGVPAWSAQAVLMRGFFALQDSLTPVVLGTVTTIVFIPLSWGLMHSPLGYAGLALGVSLSALLLLVLMLIAMKRKVGTVEGRRLAGMLTSSVVSAAFAGVVCRAVAGGIDQLEGHVIRQHNVVAVLSVVGGGVSLAVVYIVLCRLLGVEETKYALSIVARWFGRSAADPTPQPPPARGGGEDSPPGPGL